MHIFGIISCILAGLSIWLGIIALSKDLIYETGDAKYSIISIIMFLIWLATSILLILATK